MLKNFISDTDLKRYNPSFASYIPSTQADFSVQTTEAFNLVLDDLVARGFEPRKLMLPLDLGRPMTSTADQNALASISVTAAGSQLHINGVAGFRRCVITPTAVGGTTVILLEGSNDIGITDETEPTNWVTVKTFTVIAAEEVSTVITDEYKYYRVRILSISAGTTVFTAAMYETYSDRWIIWKALVIIYSSMSKDPQDIWAERARQAEQFYETAIQAYKITVDTDDDNLADDEEKSSAEIKFTL